MPHALHDRRAHGPSQGLGVSRNMLYSVATCCTVLQPCGAVLHGCGALLYQFRNSFVAHEGG